MAGLSTPNNATIFDEEIAKLEKRRTEIEAERAKLLNGQITVKGLDGTTLMDIDLGVLSVATTDKKTVERNLRQTLVENPLVPVLDNSFKKTRELREEFVGRGELSANNRPTSLFTRLIQANRHLNQVSESKSKKLGKLLASPWWLLAGFILILIWGGGPLLYILSGGAIGGKPTSTTAPVPPATVVLRSKVTATPGPTAKPKAIGAVLTNFKPATAELDSSNNSLANVQFHATSQDSTGTSTPVPPAQVGNPASSAGGLNGPHGAFLAPSRLTVAALTLDTRIERALTQNNVGSEAAVVIWPRPGEVVQAGAYPGEIGNMLILGNQQELGSLRRIQQNDEVTIYDRKGNAFIYRFVTFSPDGQTEREVDPTLVENAWVFAPTQEAILTILVTYPQPLPAVDPLQTGNNQVTPRDDYLVQKKLAYRAVLAMYAPAQVKPVGTPVAVPASAWQTVAAPVSTVMATPTLTPQPLTTPLPTPPPPTASDQPPVVTSKGTISAAPGSVIPAGLPNTGSGGSGFMSQHWSLLSPKPQ